MRKYSIFHPIIMSFYSMPLYQDVARNWRGIAFSYLLVLQLFCWIFLMYQVHLETTMFMKTVAPQWVEQVPNVTINNGELSIDRPMPYFVKNPGTGEVVGIIDTTGKYTSFEGTTASVLVLKDKILTKNKDAETRAYDLSKVKYMQFGQTEINAFLEKVKLWLAIIIYPIAVIIAVVYRLVQALIYALIGMIFANLFKAVLTYGQLYRVAVVSMTPVIILSTVLEFFGYILWHSWLIYFVISMLYLAYGVYANSKVEEDSIKNLPTV